MNLLHMKLQDIKKRNRQNEAKLKYELKAVAKIKLITVSLTAAI